MLAVDVTLCSEAIYIVNILPHHFGVWIALHGASSTGVLDLAALLSVERVVWITGCPHAEHIAWLRVLSSHCAGHIDGRTRNLSGRPGAGLAAALTLLVGTSAI